MAKPISITFRVEDGKGIASTVEAFVPAGTAQADAQAFAQVLGASIAALVDGKVTGAYISYPFSVVDITPATANSDVEEGARFTFNTADGFTTQLRLPTFKETLIVAGSQAVDTADTAVDTFLDYMTAGDGTVAPVDSRGDDIITLKKAREDFTRTRKVRA